MGKPTFTNGGRELSLKVLEVSSFLIVSGERRGRFVPQMVGHGPIQNGAEAHSGQRQPPLQIAVFQSPANVVFVETIDSIEVAPRDANIISGQARPIGKWQPSINLVFERLKENTPAFGP